MGGFLEGAFGGFRAQGFSGNFGFRGVLGLGVEGLGVC